MTAAQFIIVEYQDNLPLSTATQDITGFSPEMVLPWILPTGFS
jgi:hypothetical protein